MDSVDKISIHPPLEGEWKFLRPPGHHPNAFDFVQLDGERKSYHDKSPLRFWFGHIAAARFQCWDRPVLAPIDGTVIRVGDGWEDHDYSSAWQTFLIWYNATFRFRPREVNGRLDIRPNAGNHVMIQSPEGYIVFLAHLRNHSVGVQEGDKVSRGDFVGRVGNSGNSTMPHLHINLFDQMDDPYTAKVLPFVFRSFEWLDENGLWAQNYDALPSPGMLVRFRI